MSLALVDGFWANFYRRILLLVPLLASVLASVLWLPAQAQQQTIQPPLTVTKVSALSALAAEKEWTVSGLSSGAFMAVQLAVAHSATVAGVGVVAGGPFYCAQGNIGRALSNCMAADERQAPPSLEQQLAVLALFAAQKWIDDPRFLARQRVWIFTSRQDKTVRPVVGAALAAFYRRLVPAQNFHHQEHLQAAHALVSPWAQQNCDFLNPPFVNRCERTDSVGMMFAHLLTPPLSQSQPNQADKAAAPLSPPKKRQGVLLRFSQHPYSENKPAALNLADEGYLYVPNACRNGGCAVHMALHGCRQNANAVGLRFIEQSGYLPWADVYRVMVLFPQTAASLFNPQACWDWWGYGGDNYATRSGGQIRALYRMVERLQEKPEQGR